MNKVKVYTYALALAAVSALLGAGLEYGAEFIPATHPLVKLFVPLVLAAVGRTAFPLVDAEARRARAEAEALAGVADEHSPESAEGP